MNNFNSFARLLLCCTLVFSVTACKKGSDDPSDRDYVIGEVYIGDTRSFVYEYNDSFQVVKSSYYRNVGPHDWATRTTTYSYNSEGKLTQTIEMNTRQSSLTATPPDVRKEYTYNGQGQLSQVKVYKLDSGNLYSSDEYAYNGQTIVNTRLNNSGSVNEIWTYTLDDRGNIIKLIKANAAGQLITTEEWLNYDHNRNIDPPLGSTTTSYTAPVAGNVISKNNYRKYTITYSDPIYNPNHMQMNVTYSYNNAGYVRDCNFSNGVSVTTKTFVLKPKA
jgi:hypothetical protein